MSKHKFSPELGARIADLRVSFGWSQSQFSRNLMSAGFESAHQMTVSRIEKGHRVVGLFEAYIIAEVFGVTLDELVGRSPMPVPTGITGIKDAIQILQQELERRQQ